MAIAGSSEAELMFAISSAIFCILFVAMLIAYLTKNPTKVVSQTILQGGSYQSFGSFNWNLQAQTDSCYTFTVPSSTFPGVANFNIYNFATKGPLRQLVLRNAEATQGDSNFYEFSQTTMMLKAYESTAPNGYTLINAPASLLSMQVFQNTDEFAPYASLSIFWGDTVPPQASFTLCGWGA